MKDIKIAMYYQEANLTSFNNSLLQLSARLKEYKNQTAAELADLQTSVDSSYSSLTAQLA